MKANIISTENLTHKSSMQDFSLVSPHTNDYREELDTLALTPEQEAELLKILWEMMKSFVELGFGVDSMHLVLPEIFNNTNEAPILMRQHSNDNQGGG